MLRKRFLPVLILIALPMIAHARPIAAQETNPACNRNLSQLVAGLVEAQAALSAGDAQNALPVLRAAAEALTTIADECEASLGGESTPAPEATQETRTIQSANIPGSFRSPNGAFVFDYPPAWSISDFNNAGDGAGAIVIGSSEDAMIGINSTPPALVSGQQAAQILGGSAELITGGEINVGTIENMLSYFEGTIGELTDDIEAPEQLEINGRPAGRFLFGGESFDGVLVIVQLDEGARFVVIGALAAKGERDAILPIVDSIAASLE